MKRQLFVKTFVREVEEKLSKYNKEAKPSSKIRKAGKIANQIDSTQKDLFH
ncbi:MAG: hypothetical protein ACR5KV_00890 [Wolbachia sp.]